MLTLIINCNVTANPNPNGTAKSKSDNVITTPLQLGSAGYWLMLLLVDVTTDLELGVLHNSCPTRLKLKEFRASFLQLDQRPSVSAYNIVCMRARLRVKALSDVQKRWTGGLNIANCENKASLATRCTCSLNHLFYRLYPLFSGVITTKL